MSKSNACCAGVTALLLAAWTGLVVQAHPLSQGRVEMVVVPGKVTLWARVTLEQVLVQQALPVNDNAQVLTQADAYRAHGAYLLQHVFLSADGQPLTGKVASFAEPDAKAVFIDDVQKQFVTYELEFPLPNKPRELKLRQNVLHEIDYTEGNPWESTYITGMRQEGGASVENLLLTSSNTLAFACKWTAPAMTSATPATTTPLTVPASTAKNDPPSALNQPLPANTEIPWLFIAGISAGTLLMLVFAQTLFRRGKHSANLDQ